MSSRFKPKGHRSTVEEMRPNYAIKTSVTATKLSRCCVILKKKKKKKNYKKEKFGFMKITFFRIFKLSGLVIVHQHHYWLRNTASQFYGEILCKSRYFMYIHFILALSVQGGQP